MDGWIVGWLIGVVVLLKVVEVVQVLEGGNYCCVMASDALLFYTWFEVFV